MIDHLLEIKLREPEDFLKIVETLTRIGIVTRDMRLIQSCHILHKQNRYFIVHFKELFKLDGVEKTDILDADVERRNAIAKLLQEWKLCEIIDVGKASPSSMSKVKVVSYRDKGKYTLKQNYTIGK